MCTYTHNNVSIKYLQLKSLIFFLVIQNHVRNTWKKIILEIYVARFFILGRITINIFKYSILTQLWKNYTNIQYIKIFIQSKPKNNLIFKRFVYTIAIKPLCYLNLSTTSPNVESHNGLISTYTCSRWISRIRYHTSWISLILLMLIFLFIYVMALQLLAQILTLQVTLTYLLMLGKSVSWLHKRSAIVL